ncbi:MAG: GHMP kinase [Verrucomicrobia bacterium]|nr:GHMP kinase [Verrucomicrobiota bacterium]MCG2679189.1 GHMP kinase [Kiritimatiellia bacterium]MBU4247941.1 GHMP kinase [Verrucomicrobiota bacterium]MBU4289673.1 GHMP kinase [Verrucomicrobiota bacterium]MBU4429372.1 GHMP kinase [Verrucomicrobiota bacterium]
MIITTRAYPRVGLVGNPSDGYYGKTISFVFSNFHCEVVLYETPELEIIPNTRDHSRFKNMKGLVEDVRLFGYYGGIRLLKATVKRFYDYCREQHLHLENKQFTLRYQTNIPSHVGLAGSSAIITACLRALMQFYGVRISKPLQANLILSVEKNELGIPAGLQDRVVQVHEGLVYMDFNKSVVERQGYGQYIPMNPELLPPLYIAYRDDLSEGSEVFHNDIRGRFERGDPKVIAAMTFWANLTDQVRACLINNERDKIGPLLNANFDMRRKIYNISGGNILMVETARTAGASAKFSGSGGAIVGTYQDEPMFARLAKALETIHVTVIKPAIKFPEKESYDP